MNGAGLRAGIVRIARWTLRGVPDSILARMLPGSLGWSTDAVDVAVNDSGASRRLLVAPANSAGQAHLWARAVRENLDDVAAANLMIATPNMRKLGFATDFTVPEGAYVFAGGWQRRQRKAILRDFTHLLLESGRYPYGSVPGRTPLQIVQELRDAGVAVALVWHGSDIRLPSAHAQDERDSPFGARGTHPEASTRLLEMNARAGRRMISSSDVPIFVSTPGLLDVPRSRWLPVVVDPRVWQTSEPPLRRPRPVVAYAPSSSTLKGGAGIDQKLRELETEGLIEYRRVEGVRSDAMPQIYRGSDIVLDQFRLGDYGVAACEAMAAGRVVIGHVNEQVRRRVREATGMELPIVEARHDRVAETIRSVIADRERSAQRAAAGPTFTSAIHDGRRSAQILSDFLTPRVDGPQTQQETAS